MAVDEHLGKTDGDKYLCPKAGTVPVPCIDSTSLQHPLRYMVLDYEHTAQFPSRHRLALAFPFNFRIRSMAYRFHSASVLASVSYVPTFYSSDLNYYIFRLEFTSIVKSSIYS